MIKKLPLEIVDMIKTYLICHTCDSIFCKRRFRRIKPGALVRQNKEML